jgi:hypothetical protein
MIVTMGYNDGIKDRLQSNKELINLLQWVVPVGCLHHLDNVTAVLGSMSPIGRLKSIEETQVKDVGVGRVGWLCIEGILLQK